MHSLGLWHRKFYNLLLCRPSSISRLSQDFQWVRSLMPPKWPVVPRHLLAISTDPSACVCTGHGHRLGEKETSQGPRAPNLLCINWKVSESVLFNKPLFQVHCHRSAKATPTSADSDPLTTPDHVWSRLQEAWGVDRLPTLSPENRETFISPAWSPSSHVSWEKTLGCDPRWELQGSRVWCSLQIIESKL